MSWYFYFSVAVLALMLYFPASKIIWVLSVRRLQRKSKQELSTEEVARQKGRARFIAVLLVVAFSFLFNWNLFGGAHGA